MNKQLVKSLQLDGRVEACDYNFRDGIIFYNEKEENIVIEVDREQMCCESFKCNFPSEEELKMFYSRNGIKVDVYQDLDYKPEGDVGNKYIIVITAYNGDKTQEFNVTVSNDHNGYYWHDLKISKGKLVYETSEEYSV